MKRILLIIIIGFISQALFSQVMNQVNSQNTKARKGYIVFESNFIEVFISDAAKTRFIQCTVIRGASSQTYSADEISEYGFNDGITFVSKSISIDGEAKSFFLERFYYQDFSLFFLEYQNEEYFYFQKGDFFTEINDENKSQTLSKYTQNCNNQHIADLKLSRKSLLRYLDCTPAALHVSVAAGVGKYVVSNFPSNNMVVANPDIFDKVGSKNSVSILLYKQLRKPNYIDESNFYFGFGLDFVRFTLENEKDISVASGGNTFTNSTRVSSDQLRISLPLLIRYWKNFNKMGLILDFGVINSININSVLVTNVRTTDMVETFRSSNNISPDYQYGLLGRCGLSYQITTRIGSEIIAGQILVGGKDYTTSENDLRIGLHYNLR